MKYSESSLLIDQEFDIDKGLPIIMMEDLNIDAKRNEKAFDLKMSAKDLQENCSQKIAFLTGRSVYNVLPKVKTTPTPFQRPEIMSVTGHPFPTYLKRFNIGNSDSCDCGNLGNSLDYATSCLFTTSNHLTKPSADLEPLWWKRVMNNNNSRAKIRKLIHFIAENETLFFSKK
ncbi:hypothetical protein AVEN_93351-1 [Araneus ventricosus]|uniref:Uncharacterized protein n=1 Tax=Araneus ventricosus TaxID=182803 RepID=A0A4Y2PYH3_ARAVE|nr:hypothetical protein AVEN_93351-1 [Araneus ventricosus]